jgi:hypothetical protein
MQTMPTRFNRWESAVASECARLCDLAAPLLDALDADHRSDAMDAIYDQALKRADAAAFPPNRHARRKAANA